MSEVEIPALCLRFEVPGIPGKKGSWRAMEGRNGGRAFMVPMDKKLIPWSKRVAAAAALAMGWRQPIAGPVKCQIAYRLPRPQYHFGKGKLTAHVPLPQFAKAYPIMRTADLDKMDRAMLDAMSKLVYVDDCQVVELHAVKFFVDGREPPSVSVHIDEVES